jgi:FkbM family methyltransferase
MRSSLAARVKDFLPSLIGRTDPVYVGDHTALTRTVYGHRLFVDTRDLSVAPSILLDGVWEPWISRVFVDVVKPGMHVVDIGANLGWYSILAAGRVGPKGRLSAFEANPVLCDLVFRSLVVNGFADRSAVVNKAVFSETTTLEFRTLKRLTGGGSLYLQPSTADTLRDELITLQVPATRLDDYFAAGARVDVIKVDAEGAEPHILKGAQRVLRENRNLQLIIECEVSRFAQAGWSIETFAGELDELGFAIFRIENSSRLTRIRLQELVNEPLCDLLLKRERD